MGFPQNDPPELKTGGAGRKVGINCYIYRERILNPLLYPFAVEVKKIEQRGGWEVAAKGIRAVV